MHELIQRMVDQAGITPEQAELALDAVKSYIKDQFPMMAPAVDNLFAGGFGAPDPLG
jgi:hypothetical protein